MVQKSILFFCVMLLLVGGCKLVKEESPTGGSAVITDFKITDQIGGWSQTLNDTFVVCPTLTELSGPPGGLNGEAEGYTSNYGLELGPSSREGMQDQGSSSILIFVIDFLAPAFATTAFDKMVIQNTGIGGRPLISLTGYGEGVAAMFKIGSEYRCYAHFDRYMVRMTLYGAADLTAAKTVTGLFLEFFQARAK